MLINRSEMKRKRRDCSSPLLDDCRKRTKVHAQRKFAQGSNVNSPVLTPVKEIEKQDIDVMPEPVELLPIKRPNTEDFLTFLCFRGTPILPPNLNFFNTASIVDTNGQVHEIKSESPKNGPIDTSVIAKASGSSERPFIAFGVRKRADPIVISKQMDKKRRHALALQALRRKYQEQRMAKIRAVTISKLSETKTTNNNNNKTVLRSNSSITKTENVIKKSGTNSSNNTTNTIHHKTNKVSVVSTKHVKVTTQTVKSTLRSQMKPKMCLRSFRGRFIQRELQFRNNIKKKTLKRVDKNKEKNSDDSEDREEDESVSEYSSNDDINDDGDKKPTIKTGKEARLSPKVILSKVKVAKKSAPGPKKPSEINFRITRSNQFLSNKIKSRRQQMKQLILTTPTNLVKPRTLRSHTLKKGESFTSPSRQKLMQLRRHKERTRIETTTMKDTSELERKNVKTMVNIKKDTKETIESIKKETKSVESTKKVVTKTIENVKKQASPLIPSSSSSITTTTITTTTTTTTTSNKNKSTKSTIAKNDSKMNETLKKKEQERLKLENRKIQHVTAETELELQVEKDIKSSPPIIKKEPIKIEANNSKKDDENKQQNLKSCDIEIRTSKRPTRKTKEAAAIYMEILSHKLVNDSKIDDDDDNISIDSFPELPNVKKTEQRENELKAKAKSNCENNNDKKSVEIKNLRSSDKKKLNSIKKNQLDDDKNGKIEQKSCDRKTRSSGPLDKTIEINSTDIEADIKKVTNKNDNKRKLEMNSQKQQKSDNKESEDLTKTKRKENEEVSRRQTRNSSQTIHETTDDDSDESFRADIRIPRKRLITRNKVPKSYKTDSDDNDDDLDETDDQSLTSSKSDIKKVLRLKTKTYKEISSSESDQSTTSDLNLKTTTRSLNTTTTKNKRYTKTRSQRKSDPSFSDSDEEPLSKLTQNKLNEIKDTKKNDDEKKETLRENKPKRECAKRPQNYLPMFSSSEEDDFFFGYGTIQQPDKPIKTNKLQEKNENKNNNNNNNNNGDNNCSHAPTTSDIGRRFGKGKVNMSNEQIEKWLKDSAMAGSFKNDNDEMLTFQENIPTDTSMNIADTIDTEKLKTSLLLSSSPDLDDKVDLDCNKKETTSITDSCINEKLETKINISKPNLDRKLIFRKDKTCAIPNINAFSADNESSVYAFEETEDLMKTPFRRPSRRPSSTGTSRSEDESSKIDDSNKSGQFRKPSSIKQDSIKFKNEIGDEDSSNFDQNIQVESDNSNQLKPSTSNIIKVKSKTEMVPPQSFLQKIQKSELRNPKVPIKNTIDDDFKYKIPSSPSASSSSSAKLYKKQAIKSKLRTTNDLQAINVNEFPLNCNTAQLVVAPTFYPNEKEFQDPIEFIEKIRPKAEQFGICRIVPPNTFKPECKVTDDMRFTAYNQYVHKMLHRWGPNFKELMAIKKYLSTQNISLTHPPWIGGMEVDLPRLYQTVQSLGGLKEVIEKKKWPKVSDAMKIPKSAQDRVTKLDDIYCKYLLPYDTLSPAEREKLFDEVETEWAKRESKSLQKVQQNANDDGGGGGDNDDDETDTESDNEAEECIVKGRGMALNAFYRIARNTMSMWFKTSEPPVDEVEQEFWKHVTLKQNHICVHSGSIDSGSWGYGFAVSKNSPFARHAWNLKVLTNNSGSVLRSLGPIMGVTVPTLHVGMVFSSCCWYRDPHSLPWIEYLHTGGNKIWYGIPDTASESFHNVLKKLVPNYCQNKTLWLPSDTVMVPPNLLVDNGVSLCRIVQEPGQFIVVFPKVFTSSISTGYVVSESVYFAPPYWLNNARKVFDVFRNSCEPSMFSLDRLLLCIVNDTRTNIDVLKQILPVIIEICDNEKIKRNQLRNLGINIHEKLPLPEAPNVRKKKKTQDDDCEYECEICRMNLFISMIREIQEDEVYCLDHAIEQLENKRILNKNCKLLYTYDDNDLECLPEKIHGMIESKMQKKTTNKYTGMPTLLK